MFAIGDSFIYGENGICTLVDIQRKTLAKEPRVYYVLAPAFTANSLVYVPTDSPRLAEKIRPLLTPEEIYALIDGMPAVDTLWVEPEAARQDLYRHALTDGDRNPLIGMIKAIFAHQQQLKADGRKPRISDERFLKEAEKLLYDEFAYVLKIKQEDVLPLILERLGIEDNKASKKAVGDYI